MRKSTLFLLLSLSWLYAETIQSTDNNLSNKKVLATKSDLTTATWKRKDVIESIKSQDQARKQREERLDSYRKKLMLEREKAYLKDDRVHAPDLRDEEDSIEAKNPKKKIEKQNIKTQTEESKQAKDKKVVALENMTIEMQEKPQKSDAPAKPAITIEVSDKQSQESGSMIIKVKDQSKAPTPQVTMEFVKIKEDESSVEKVAYPKKFIKVEEENNHE